MPRLEPVSFSFLVSCSSAKEVRIANGTGAHVRLHGEVGSLRIMGHVKYLENANAASCFERGT